MRPIDQSLSDADLQQRRVAIRRDLVRGNTTAILLLIALVGLALLAALKASQADTARREATEKLWESYRAQARAARLTGEAGQRAEALAAIAAAAKIRPSQELANDAIAALALTDIRPVPNQRHLAHDRLAANFNADLTMYAVRTPDKTEIRTFPAQEPVLEWRAPNAPDTVRFSEDGKLVALGYPNGRIEIRDLTTTNETWSTRVPAGMAATMDWAREGQLLAYRISPRKLVVSDFHTKTELWTIENTSDFWRAKFSPDSKKLALFGHNRVTIWSLEPNQPKKLREFATPHNLNDVAWHHDSSEIAAGCENHLIYVWDLMTGRQGTMEGHTREVVTVSYSPTSNLLVSYAWDGTSRFWNTRTGSELFKSHQGWARSFRRDGKALSYYAANAGFGIWEIVESEQLAIIGSPLRAGSWMRWVDFSPDGKLLAIAYYGETQIWDVQQQTLLAEIPGRDIKSAVFSKSGALISSDTKGVREIKLDWKEGKIDAVEAPAPLYDKHVEKTFVVSLDRRTGAFAGGPQGGIGIIDMESGLVRELGRHPGSGNVALSSDGKRMAVSTWKGAGTRVWDVETGKMAVELDRRDSFVNFSPDDRWLVSGRIDEYCFWDTHTWSNAWSLKREALVHATGPVAFSSDGKIGALSLTGWSLDVLDLERRTVTARLAAPILSPVTAIDISDDGTRLAAAMTDGYVQLWDLAKLRDGLAQFKLKAFHEAEPGLAIVIAPGSSRIPAIILIAVVSALFVGVTGLQRHRRLVEEYSSIEKLVMDRNAQVESYRTELAHSQKMRALGTLAAGIAHDFNNLLSVIRMANKLTAKEGRANSDIAANVAVVEQAVEQGKQVVKSMLGYSRAGEADAGPYSVAELVENVVPLLSRQFLAGITLTLELDYTTPTVTRARNRLQQVLLNLIVNASEAMAGQGKLKITVKTEQELKRHFVRKPEPSSMYVRLSVGDSGPGIPAEVLPRIFEPFYTTKNVGADPGTGLGLSVVYTVAEEEGLGLAVDTAPGVGATFHIYIPVSAENEIKAEGEAHPDTLRSQVARV